ncbi:MAG TPA: tRNA pseudouridine(55) synthase TruB [Candidatus Nanoarchaeia archaeon]|nr:tRNA pseudouridine(55) synthase TruB [Candidatus Nanoarchaeia archaeon]
MQKLSFLNTRDRKEVSEMIGSQWGAKLGDSFVFLINDKKDTLYIFSRDVEKIDISALHIDTLGLYFAEVIKDERRKELRLSMEGSQIIGHLASKNIVEIDAKDAKHWLAGENVFNKSEAEGWVIVKSGEDFLGCGRVKEKIVLNYVPKARRIAADSF